MDLMPSVGGVTPGFDPTLATGAKGLVYPASGRRMPGLLNTLFLLAWACHSSVWTSLAISSSIRLRASSAT